MYIWQNRLIVKLLFIVSSMASSICFQSCSKDPDYSLPNYDRKIVYQPGMKIQVIEHGDTLPWVNEIVMLPGMQITARTKVCTMRISAGEGLIRSYFWDGDTRSVSMWPRGERWFGSLGIYFPGHGRHWKLHSGMNRGILEEGQLHFESESEAIEWLKNRYRQETLYSYVYNDSGLVVMCGLHQNTATLHVDVWQIYIDGRKPIKLEGSQSSRIACRYSVHSRENIEISQTLASTTTDVDSGIKLLKYIRRAMQSLVAYAEMNDGWFPASVTEFEDLLKKNELGIHSPVDGRRIEYVPGLKKTDAPHLVLFRTAFDQDGKCVAVFLNGKFDEMDRMAIEQINRETVPAIEKNKRSELKPRNESRKLPLTNDPQVIDRLASKFDKSRAYDCLKQIHLCLLAHSMSHDNLFPETHAVYSDVLKNHNLKAVDPVTRKALIYIPGLKKTDDGNLMLVRCNFVYDGKVCILKIDGTVEWVNLESAQELEKKTRSGK